MPVIGKGVLESVVKQRRHAPVLIADLGVPRDVEAEAAESDDVFLYSIDDLQGIVKETRRTARSGRTRRTDDRRPDDAFPSLARRSFGGAGNSGPVESLRSARDGELDRARRMLAAGESPSAALEALARGLTNRLLHAPLSALNAAGDAERAELMTALTHVYRLDVAQETGRAARTGAATRLPE